MTLGAVVVAIDGSDASLHAARAGYALLQAADVVVVATVIDALDPTLVTGTGIAGGVMSAEEFDANDAALLAEAQSDVDAAVAALGANAEGVVVRGDPGPALCDLARERSAQAIVMGSRGRGGIKRALLGSVSDYVVRNAHCPVVITGPPEG